MQVEEMPSLKGIVATFEEAQKRVSDADLIGGSRSALTSARGAVARGWPRRRRASRWPWVAGAVVGMTVLAVLLVPAVRRWSASRRAIDGPGDITGVGTPDWVPSTHDNGDLLDPAGPDAFDTAPLLDRGMEEEAWQHEPA